MKKIFLSLLLSLAFTQLFADSLDIKIGQMIMAGMNGHSVNQQSGILQDVKRGIVGGILLFERNLNPASAKKSLQNLTTNLQNAATIPLIISIDQEGGQVNRLKTKYGFPVMPSAKSVGDRNIDSYTTEIAGRIAQSPADGCRGGRIGCHADGIDDGQIVGNGHRHFIIAGSACT